MPGIANAVSPILTNGVAPFRLSDLSALMAAYWDADAGVSLVAAPVPALVDGNMEAVGVTSWNAIRATLSKETGTPHGGTRCLRITGTEINSAFATQNGVFVTGSTYRIRGWARSDGSATPMVGYVKPDWTGTTSTEWQPFDFTFTADAITIGVYGVCTAAGQYVEFDDLTIERVDGGGIIFDGNMEADVTTVWSPNAVTLTKQTGTPHSGTRCLRMAPTGAGAMAYQGRLITGNVYRIRGWFRGDGTASPIVWVGGSDARAEGTSSTEWQAFDVTGVTSNIYFYIGTNSVSGYVEFDDITVENLSLSAWADQSGNAKHYTQATAASRPALEAAVFGSKSGIRFRATYAQFLSLLAAACVGGLASAHAFIVMKLADDTPADATMDGLWKFSGGTGTRYPFSGDNTFYDDFGASVRKDLIARPGGLNLETVHCYEVFSTANEWTSKINGTQTHTTATNTVFWASPEQRLGNSSLSGTIYLDGWVGAFFIFNTRLTGEKLLGFKQYLTQTYGVTFS